MDIGTPIARGRTADIYAWQDGQILKLFHDWFARDAIEYEARLGRLVHAAGLPAPAVGEIVCIDQHNGLIYQRIHGITMSEILLRKPWQVFRQARRLADLHGKIHAVSTSLELPSQRQRLVSKMNHAIDLPVQLRNRALTALNNLPEGRRICHGDFHPENVMIASGREVVIDWIDATCGNPLADVARTSILIMGAANSSQMTRQVEKWLVRIFHAAYLRHYFHCQPGGEKEYRQWLPVVAAARLSENIPEVWDWLITLVEKGLPPG